MQQIITLQYNNTFPVSFQTSDAFINATQIAKQFGKKTENYLRTNETKEYVSALQKWLLPAGNSNALKSVVEQNQLVIVKNGAPENGGGTWLHPKLAVNFARWLSADFAVWCDMQIEDLLYKQDKRFRLQLEAAPTSFLISEAEKMNNVPFLTYFKLLQKYGYIFKRGKSKWMPTKKGLDAGVVELKLVNPDYPAQLHLTAKGLADLTEITLMGK